MEEAVTGAPSCRGDRESSSSINDDPSSGGLEPEISVSLLQLPEDVLHGILQYSAPPTERASVLCHRLAPTCSVVHSAVESGLNHVWSAILSEEYGGGSSSGRRDDTTGDRRASKRLRRSPKSQVEAAHRLLLDRTNVAHYALTEMVHSSRTSLTLARLRWVMREYGPHVRVNHRADIGGTFLVECCRARYVEERAVLSCVKELVERHGADPDLAAASERRSRGGGGGSGSSARASGGGARWANVEVGLTPLCVASARGMPTVVRFLLRAGASPRIAGTGRFRLHCNSSKSVFGTFDPLCFARRMREAELLNGATEESLKDLNKCIKILERAVKDDAEWEE